MGHVSRFGGGGGGLGSGRDGRHILLALLDVAARVLHPQVADVRAGEEPLDVTRHVDALQPARDLVRAAAMEILGVNLQNVVLLNHHVGVCVVPVLGRVVREPSLVHVDHVRPH